MIPERFVGAYPSNLGFSRWFRRCIVCDMAGERDRSRTRERLERLSESGVDCDSLRLEAIAELQRTVGFDRWCWPLADPETLLPLSGLAEHAIGLEHVDDDPGALRGCLSQ